MWDLPRPGLEPVFPALAGRFSTTAPAGKPVCFLLFSSGQKVCPEKTCLLVPAPSLHIEDQEDSNAWTVTQKKPWSKIHYTVYQECPGPDMFLMSRLSRACISTLKEHNDPKRCFTKYYVYLYKCNSVLSNNWCCPETTTKYSPKEGISSHILWMPLQPSLNHTGPFLNQRAGTSDTEGA